VQSSVKQGPFDTTLRLVAQLQHDPEDLIHKAVRWMLREIGKRDIEIERDFLRMHYQTMPRTMLRCAIERFQGGERLSFFAWRSGVQKHQPFPMSRINSDFPVQAT